MNIDNYKCEITARVSTSNIPAITVAGKYIYFGRNGSEMFFVLQGIKFKLMESSAVTRTLPALQLSELTCNVSWEN